jgi:TIR domain
MAEDLVPVTFEWAHFGKESDSAGYGVLACSDGVFTSEQFAREIAEYWPGSLPAAELPQVTISWLSSAPDEYNIAMTIHRPGHHGSITTDYFTAPFSELSAGSVSFLAMFNELSKIKLPLASKAPVKALLQRNPERPEIDGSSAALASQVAALLLAAKPVCVLGADQVSYTDRLKFLDSVASLLPYRPRITLSASTWASSTHREHNLRLFFASADRRTGDYLVHWTQDGGATSSKHVFISYAREDSEKADRLQSSLEAAGIPVWRESSHLWPGEDWRLKIRHAIMEDTLVFIACFSSHGLTRAPRFQNEEISWAVQQLLAYSPEVPWFIPVRFDDCEIPDRDIGGNRTLRSLHHVDLFGPHLDYNIARVVRTVQRMLQDETQSPLIRPDTCH